MEFALLDAFASSFRNGPYLHRNSQLGNRVADYLFDDLYELRADSRLREEVDDGRLVLNPKGVSPGIRARRGDGSFGPIVPGYVPIHRNGHSIPVGPTAAVDIGVEVKILAKAMIKQVDRVISDLCGQAVHFRDKSPRAVSVGIVGVNHATEYVSYEGAREYPTGEYGPHPSQEALDAMKRLVARADGCFEEFVILPFRATNRPPYPFEWVDRRRTADQYGAMLVRLLRRYQG